MNQHEANQRYANGNGNLYALDKHLDEEDKRGELLEEWEEITKTHFDAIEEALFHIRNKEEAFSDLDLTDEIKSRVMELL